MTQFFFLTRDELDTLKVSYDNATPQSWFNEVLDETGKNPCGHIVWSYKNSFGGEPFPVTEDGVEILRQMEEAKV